MGSRSRHSTAGGTFKSSQDRAGATASVDSGSYFDRNIQLVGKDYRQTFEPRAFYLYVLNKGPERHPGL